MDEWTQLMSYWSAKASAERAQYVRLRDDFTKRMLREHAGYAQIKPAFPPAVVEPRTIEALSDTTNHIVNLLVRMGDRVLTDGGDRALQELGFTNDDCNMLRECERPPLPLLARMFARADYLVCSVGLQLLELNVSAVVGGIGILDRYNDILRSALQACRLERWLDELGTIETGVAWTRTVRSAYDMCADVHGNYGRVALVCLADEIEIPPPQEAARILSHAGYEATIVSIDDLAIGESTVLAAGRKIDCAYGCFTFDDLRNPKTRELVIALVRAHLRGAVSYFVPPLAAVYGTKALLAKLWQELDSGRLSTDDAALVRSLVPETRLLSPESLDWARRERHKLVAKPALGHSGVGVSLGMATTASEWNTMLHHRLKEPGTWILQRYCPPANVTWPAEGPPQHVVLGLLSFLQEPLGGVLVRARSADSQEPINCSQGSRFSSCFTLKTGDSSKAGGF